MPDHLRGPQRFCLMFWGALYDIRTFCHELQVPRTASRPHRLPQLAPHRLLLQTSGVSALQVTRYALEHAAATTSLHAMCHAWGPYGGL